MVARTGSHAPGTPDDVVFDNFFSIFNDRPLVINDRGETAFRAVLGMSDGSSLVGDRTGIWSHGGGNLHLVAREGSAAPGTPAGVNFHTFYWGGSPVINNAGQTAFRARLTGAGVDLTNDTGIWSEEGGSLQLVAREGSAAPGTEAGVNFSGFSIFDNPVLSSGGRVAFSAPLTGPGVDGTNQIGIWKGVGADLNLVARAGDPAPGTGAGVNFMGVGQPALNSAGQTAFIATLFGTGVDSTNAAGIWAEGPRGLELVVRAGDLLEVVPGDLRKVLQLSFIYGSGNEDGQPSGFNERGQLAFRANFTDGTSGVFVTDLGVVPEPASAALALGAAAGLLLLRRRSRRPIRQVSKKDSLARHPRSVE